MDSLGLGGETAKKSAMWLYPKVLGFNPPERWGHSACYSHGIVYVFGGCCGGLHFGDVLMLNLETMVWSKLATTGQGPGPRDSHSAVLVGRKMIVFGGTNGYKKVNDLHILDLDSKQWIRPECRGDPPSPRESHTATLVHDDKMVIFGGSGEGEANYLNDLHVLNLKTMRWASPTAKGDIPVPRDSHSANVIANRLFVYGGDCGDRYHGDIDMLDLRTLTWSRLAVKGSSPGVRAGHAAVNIGTKVCIIGGVGDKHYYNDIWILDVTTCLWSQLDTRGQQPQGRFSHTAVVTDSDVVIYGGCGEDERPLNELLVLLLGAEHLNGRYNISMCKIFGNHWNQAKRRFSGGAEDNSKNVFSGSNKIPRKQAHEAELELKQAFPFASGILHPRKSGTPSLTNAWEIELEQEEHSLSLSRHSSPSQSDQEQSPVLKASDSVAGSQGLQLFKQMNQIPKRFQANNGATNQRESWNMIQKTTQDHQFSREHQNHQKSEQILPVVRTGGQGTQHPAEPQSMEAWPIQNLIGAEVQGKIDGAFDSGFLMTAAVNGKVFRGVLFPHGPGILSRGSPLAQLCPHSNHAQPFKLSQRPIVLSTPESAQKHRQNQANNRHLHIVRSTSPLGKQPKQRSDLEGVVLTLGGPGTAGS